MNNKLTICFPLEVKRRELISKLYLSYLLLKTKKIDIVIGDKKFFFIDYEKSKNLIFFYKGGGKHLLNLFKGVSKNNYIFNLDEEGPISMLTSIDHKLKVNNQINKYIHKIILWGENDKKIYEKRKCYEKKKTYILGHPKLDLLKKPYLKLFKKDYESINKNFKNFIFIVSHYNVDGVIDDENYHLYIQNLHLQKKDKIKKMISDQKNKYSEFVQLIKKIAEKNPNKQFIFRPHPAQDLDKVIKSFGNFPKNLKIIFKYTVTPWIIACDQYIHAGCTTVFEAEKLKKKITYISNFGEFDSIWSNIGYKFFIRDEDKILSFFKKDIKVPKINNPKKINAVVKNINKEYEFGKNFVNMLKKENYLQKKSSLYMRNYDLKKSYIKYFLSYIKTNVLKIKIIARLAAHYIPDFVLTKKLKNSKFYKCNRNELVKILLLFTKLDNSNIKFKVSKLNEHMFKIGIR